MRCVLRSILVVALGILPSTSCTQADEQADEQKGWHVEHYPQTGDMVTEYWATQIKVPVVTMDEELKAKTHVTMMFMCSPRFGSSLGMKINLLYGEKPKYTTNRKRSGDIIHYETILLLDRAGLKEPRFYKTDVFTWSKGSMIQRARSLGILPDFVLRILAHDELRICVLSEWDGKLVMSIVPLGGVSTAVYEALAHCGMSNPM